MVWLLIFAISLVAVLVYAYAGFPLLMFLVGLRPQVPPSKRDDPPLVSLIIPAHNEADVIDAKIKNSLRIDYPNLEVIVASDGSTDGTVEIAQNHEGIRLLPFEQQRGKTALVADAVDASKGEILCLCDANVMFRPDAVWRLVSHLADSKVGCVTGDVRLQSEASSFGLAESLFYKLERGIHCGESNLGSVMGVDGGMFVIRRDLFPTLATDTKLDDFSISMHVIRSGKRLLYEPTAIADENATEAATDEFNRRVRMGIGITQVLSRGFFPRLSQPRRMFLFVSHKLLRWLSPWLLICIFLAVCVLSFYYPFVLTALVPGLSVLTLALAGALWPRLRKFRIVVIPFYFVLSQVAFAWGMIRGIFFDSSGVWSRTKRQPLLDEAGE